MVDNNIVMIFGFKWDKNIFIVNVDVELIKNIRDIKFFGFDRFQLNYCHEIEIFITHVACFIIERICKQNLFS